MNLNVVLIRLPEERIAYGHVVSSDDRHHTWCGATVPQFIIDDWDTPHNVFVNKHPASCQSCIKQWHLGRPAEILENAE